MNIWPRRAIKFSILRRAKTPDSACWYRKQIASPDLFFARAAIVSAEKNIIFRDNNRDTKRNSVHQSRNEDNFPTFCLGPEFLNESEIEKNKGKGDSASAPSRFTSLSKCEMQKSFGLFCFNWSFSTFKGKLKFFRFKIVKYERKPPAFNRKLEMKQISILLMTFRIPRTTTLILLSDFRVGLDAQFHRLCYKTSYYMPTIVRTL